jgi:hypothetical protein
MGHWATYRRRGSNAPPAAALATVLSVIRTGATWAKWTFSVEISVTSVPAPELQVQVAGVWTSPADFNNIGPDWLELEYDDVIDVPGPWRVLTKPTGMAFAGGIELLVPESGTYP